MSYQSSKFLPTLDYVSIVRSLYKDRRAMLFGNLSSAVCALVTALSTGAPVLFLHTALFVALVVSRDYNMRAFTRATIEHDNIEAAAFWERRAILFGCFAAVVYGSWCFSALVLVRDPFAVLVSISVTIAAMVGIVTRNFGSDKLMTVQILGMGGPMIVGLLLVGDIHHFIFAAMFLPMLVSFRSLGADVRNMLLSAVHERVMASRLADQLDTALETMQHGLCMLDENGVIAVANDQAQQTFSGIAEGTWVGRTLEDLLTLAISSRALPQASAERLLRLIDQKLGGKIVIKLGGDSYTEVTVSSREDRTVLLFENVTARIKAQERINYMARYDSLTDLPNRTHFTELVDADLAARRRMPGSEAAVLMIIDLDDFKHINDSLGHLAGDKVLTETASRIRSAMHRSSLLARFGGDEFIVYRATQTGSISGADEAMAILEVLCKPYELDGERIELHASIGLVAEANCESNLDDLTTRADLAVSRAKAQGKNQWQEFAEEMEGEFRYRQRLKVDLRDAVANGQLRLVYQPLVDLKTRQVAGCEALARWTHPELGPIAPNVFIPLAEEMGLVSDITRWVLRTATAECCNWPEPISVSVNVSARDLRNDELAVYVAKALEESGLAARRLEIEVTETALIEERDVASLRLGGLAARGIGISLDDFGTGYSSLSYLHEMPFSKLKIDRSFIEDITTNPRSMRLLSNVARLGKDLDLILTAEGVETEEQLDLIGRDTMIDQVQGYLFGMPLPAHDVSQLIASMHGATSAEPHERQESQPSRVIL